MSEADKRQEGGSHYKGKPILPQVTAETWNLIIPMGWSAFQFEIINYVDRYKRKGGIEDLKKARHWLDKLIELETIQAGVDFILNDSFGDGRIVPEEISLVDPVFEEATPTVGYDSEVTVVYSIAEKIEPILVTGDKCCAECGAQPGKAHGPH